MARTVTVFGTPVDFPDDASQEQIEGYLNSGDFLVDLSKANPDAYQQVQQAHQQAVLAADGVRHNSEQQVIFPSLSRGMAPSSGNRQQVLGIASQGDKEARAQADYLVQKAPEVLTPVPALAAAQVAQGIGGKVRQIGDVVGSDGVASWGKNLAEQGQLVEQQVQQEKPLEQGTWANSIRNALTSIYQQVPGMVVGGTLSAGGKAVAGTAAALVPMGATTGGASYHKLRERGFDTGAASLGSAIDEVVEMGTELLPTATILKAVTPAAKLGLKQFVGKLLQYGGSEYVGETLATLGQDVNDRFFANPTLTPEQRNQQIENYFTKIDPQTGNVPAWDNFKETMRATTAQNMLMMGGGAGVRSLAGQAPHQQMGPQVDESYTTTDDMPPPTGPLSKAVNQAVTAAPTPNLPVPVNTIRVTPQGQGMAPAQYSTLQTVPSMTAAEIATSRQKLQPETVTVTGMAPTQQPTPQQPAVVVPTTNELLLDDARDWAAQRIKEGNTALMQVKGEPAQAYAERLVSIYTKLKDVPPMSAAAKAMPLPPLVNDHVPVTAPQRQMDEETDPLPVPGPRSPVPVVPHPANVVNPTRDHLVTAIVKNGGIDLAEARNQLGTTFVKDSARTLNKQAMVQRGRFGHVFTSRGVSLDTMRERLVEDGYLQPEATLADLSGYLEDAARGQHRYATQYQPDERELSAAEEAHAKKLYGDQALDFPAGGIPAPIDPIMRDKVARIAEKHGWNVDIDALDANELADFINGYEQWAKESSRGAAPPASIGSLIAERRALKPEIHKKGVADNGSVSEVRKEAEQPQEVSPVRREDVTLVDQQAHEAASSPLNDLPEPTTAQIEAGNYKKGHVKMHGLDISIENPAGSVRKGTDENGRPWETKLAHHYGYIKGTIGKDKDHIDVFVGPHPESGKIFVVDQKNVKTGGFDEHKVMLGFDTTTQAQAGYLKNYDTTGPQRIMSVSEVSVDAFKTWLKEGNTKEAFNRPIPTPAPTTENASESKSESRPAAAAPVAAPATLIDQEIASMSLDDMASLFDEVAGMAAAPKEERNRVRFRETQRKALLQKLLQSKDAKEIQRLKAKMQTLQAEVKAEVEPAPAGKPEKDTGEQSYFKKGDRVQFANGIHGEVVQVDSYTITKSLLDITRQGVGFTDRRIETNHMYNVRKDNGVVVPGYYHEMFREMDPAPKVVPAPVYNGKSLDADFLKARIKSTQQTIQSNRNAAERARKADKIKALQESANDQEAEVRKMAAILKEWAGKYPDEARALGVLEEPQPQGGATAAEAPAVSGLRVTFNKEKNGIELHFAGKPSDDVLSRVKNMGFRWSRGQRVWYAKDTEPRRQFAERLTGKTAEQAAASASVQEMGSKAYRDGKERLAPAGLAAADKTKWYEGWDKAHVSTPLPAKVTPQVLPVSTQPAPTYTPFPTREAMGLPVASEQDTNGVIKTPDWWKEYTDHGQREILKKLGITYRLWHYFTPEERARIADHVDGIPHATAVVHYMGDGPVFGAVAEPTTRNAADIIKAAAESGVKGAGESIKGLYELFGGASLKSFPGGIDADTYAKAKPHFQAALQHFREAGKSLQEYFGFLADQFGSSIKPYVMRFMEDLQRGNASNTVVPSSQSGIMVNEKDTTLQEEPYGLQGADNQAAAVGEPEGTATPEVRGDSDRGAAGSSADSRGAGATADSSNGKRSAAGSAVSAKGPGTEQRPARSSGSGGKGNDGVLAGGVNYRITDADNLGKGGAKQKARDNIAAIKLVKELTAAGRAATPAEQAVLVKYVGWGASELANGIFAQSGYNPTTRRYADTWYKEGWEDLGQELHDLLTPEEYAAAKKSTMNAHYTAQGIIAGMYRALEQFGFTGGRILEPGCGVGHFVGMLPDAWLANSRFTGVELDNTSAAIAKMLYPGHDIRHQGFEKFTMPDGFYDVAIGNPPFADIDILSDPAYAKHKFKLHDFFFAKALDKVRTGGLLMFVTSKGTMDKANDKARAFMAERADLLGAIRLPQTAFKENAGTEVVTDVLFLRKREKGAVAAGEAWAALKEIETPDGPTYINEYFADHAAMILGTSRLTGTMYRDKSYTVEPLNGTSLEDQFDFAVRNFLPEKVYTVDKAESPADRPTVEYDLAPSSIKEGAFYLDEAGNVLSKENGVGVPVAKAGPAMQRIRAFIPLRDAVRQVLYVQLTAGDLAAAQKDLTRAYNAFVKQFGIINLEKRITTTRNGKESVSVQTPNFTPFRDDPDAYLVASIEKFDSEKNTAVPGPIFTERTIKPEVIPQISSISDALHVVMHETGRVDIAAIADHMDVTEKQAIDALGSAIYRNPQTGQWETDDEYLSGNVKQKLALAESTAQADPQYSRNVEALKAVQPVDLPPSRISINLGSPVVKPEYVEQFAKEIISMGIKVAHVRQTGSWGVEKVSGYTTAEATSDWGTKKRDAAQLIDDALNARQIRIEKSEPDGNGGYKMVFDKDATTAANEKLVKIRERFRQWIWDDPARAEQVARVYNDTYNNTVKRAYGGDHIEKMTFPGMSAVVNPYEHQKRVAWRVVQSGNTYMAHSVGAGKTIGSILAGMEMKRLGIKKKPCWVVPNHMLKQFSSEFLQLYPAAKIMVADETQFSKENRNRFMGRVAAENWDGIIITHSAFGKMQVSPEFSSEYIQEQIDELEWELSMVDKGDRLKRKQIERAKARLEQRLEKVLSTVGKDQGVTFEETGIDQLFVDEAHEFRKLDFVTNQTNIKGIDPNGSLMSFDLYVKSRYLEKLYPGRSLVLMSGTPITNTIGEIFTIQRFLQGPLLTARGLDNFDAWAATFGDMVTNLEATPAGNYKPVTRFARFTNLSTLSQMWGEVGDFVHAKDLTYLKRPRVRTGGRELVTAEQSSLQKQYKLSLASRIKAIEARKRPPQKGDDILLSVITDGRHAALDERYIAPTSPVDQKNNKLEKMCSNVAEIWRDTKAEKSTQMIFADLGLPGTEETRGFSAYKRIKESLIEKGIPANEIAFIQDYKKSDEKQKLFRAMNEGRVRVLVGSSEAMGTGVNAQKKLVALHHLDPDTYLPSNIEQREGRIVRQGNENDEVRLFAYVTRGSYDETMWQFLETKQRFIDQFLSGESLVDDATDVDGSADSFAMARAMSSDNPLVLERAGLEADIQRLESLRRAYFDDQQALRRNAMRAQGNLPEYRKEIANLEKLIAKRIDTAGDAFSLTFAGQVFDKRKDAGEALGKEIERLLQAGKEVDWHTVGTVAGLNIQVRAGVTIKVPFVNMVVGINGTNSSPLPFIGLDSVADLDAVGLAMKLENLARKFDGELTTIKSNVARDEKILADSKDRIGRPFEHAQTLEDKRARLEEIEQILKAEEVQAAPPTDDAASSTSFLRRRWEDGEPLAEDEIRSIVARITVKWMDADRQAIVLRNRFTELPPAIQAEAVKSGYDPHNPKQRIPGVLHKGMIYLVQEHLYSPIGVEEVLLHERLHRVLQGQGRKQLAAMMNSLLLKMGGSKGLVTLAGEVGFDFAPYRQQAAHMRTEDRAAFYVEEFLTNLEGLRAYEPLSARVQRAIREFWGKFRAWLRDNHFDLIAEFVGLQMDRFTQADLAWTLRGLRQLRGDAQQETVLFSADELLSRLEAAGISEDQLQRVLSYQPKFAAAWHGSPHDHDGFSTEYIGTGEGAQAYGYGHYFASNKAVAEFYRDQLSKGNALSQDDLKKYFTPGNIVPSYSGRDRVVKFIPEDETKSWYVVVHAIDRDGNRVSGPEGRNRTHFTMPTPAQYERVTGEKPKLGRLYQVELAPLEDEYLLWDKALSEQHDKVKVALISALEKVEPSTRQRILDGADRAAGAFIYKSLAIDIGGSDQAASEYLHSLGIRGIKYADRTSRNKPGDEREVNYNYVIFNDADVDITAKFLLKDIARVDVPGALTKVRDFLNPLDYSRFSKTAAEWSPEPVKLFAKQHLATPLWIKETTPGAAKFYDEGAEREVKRFEFNIRMFGGLFDKAQAQLKGVDKVRSWLQWTNAETAWGKLRRENYKPLTDQERAAYDVLRFEGDAMGTQYVSLATAKMNPRIKASGITPRVFAFYEKALAEERRAFEVKLQIVQENMEEAGIDPEKIKGHIAEFRAEYKDIEGWVHRDHGHGEHVVTVRHVIDRLDFSADVVTHKDEPADRIRLSYYPGVALTNQIRQITEDFGGSFKQTRSGALVLLFKEGIGAQALEQFGELDLETNGKPYTVLQYNRFARTKAGADRLAKQVKADLAAAMPRNYRPGHIYQVESRFSDKVQEWEFQAMQTSDMEMERVLTEALAKAKRKGELAPEDFTDIQTALVQNTAEALLGRGAGLYQIRRAAYLIEGYDTSDAIGKYESYVNGVAGMLSKARYALRQYKHLRTVKPELREWAFTYVQDSLRNMGISDRLSGNLRAIASLWYLGFNFSWMLINASQPHMLGSAELSRHTKGAARKIIAAQRDIMTDRLTAEERELFTREEVLNQERESFMAELAGANEAFTGKASRALHTITKGSMLLGQKVEVLNRRTTILAAYRTFIGQGLPAHKALEQALHVNSLVNIDMGRHNLPRFARTNAAGRTVYALQSYGQHILNFIYHRSTSGKGRDQKAVLRFLFVMGLLGGLPAAVPGSDELDKLMRTWWGYSPKLALRGWLKSFAREYGSLGEALLGFVLQVYNHGLPGAVLGISLTGAIQLRLPVVTAAISGEDLSRAVTGAVGGLGTKAMKAAEQAGRGDLTRALETAAPTAIANVMSGMRQTSDGVRTVHGKPVFYKGKPLTMTPAEGAIRMLGMQPARTADVGETRGVERSLSAEWNQRRKDALDQYRFGGGMAPIREFNEELRESQADGLIPPIAATSMQHAKASKRATRWERQHGLD